MTLFVYNPDQRAAILACLPGTVYFGTVAAADKAVISALEAGACEYIRRVRMSTLDGVQRKLDALKIVVGLVSGPEDEVHRERLIREIERWEFEVSLLDRPRERRARQIFMIGVFEIFSCAEDSGAPLVEHIALSDSNSPARNFFEAAIVPVCEAAGEPLKIRAAINAFRDYQQEMRLAEIQMLRGLHEYAVNSSES